jgi:hypothetical protein
LQDLLYPRVMERWVLPEHIGPVKWNHNTGRKFTGESDDLGRTVVKCYRDAPEGTWAESARIGYSVTDAVAIQFAASSRTIQILRINVASGGRS